MYKAWVKLFGDSKWTTNGRNYNTKEEAEAVVLGLKKSLDAKTKEFKTQVPDELKYIMPESVVEEACITHAGSEYDPNINVGFGARNPVAVMVTKRQPKSVESELPVGFPTEIPKENLN